MRKAHARRDIRLILQFPRHHAHRGREQTLIHGNEVPSDHVIRSAHDRVRDIYDDVQPIANIREEEDGQQERDGAGGIFTIVGDMSRASEFEDEFGGVFSTDETNASAFSRDGGVFLFIEDGFEGQDVFAREHGFGGLRRVFQRRSVYEFWGYYRVCWGVRDECRGGFILVVATNA